MATIISKERRSEGRKITKMIRICSANDKKENERRITIKTWGEERAPVRCDVKIESIMKKEDIIFQNIETEFNLGSREPGGTTEKADELVDALDVPLIEYGHDGLDGVVEVALHLRLGDEERLLELGLRLVVLDVAENEEEAIVLADTAATTTTKCRR